MENNNVPTVIFEYYPPRNGFIGIVSIPHSGEVLPAEFKDFLSPNMQHLMQDVDFRVHELVDIDKLVNAGVAVIKSNIIRTAIDLNRPKGSTLLNWKANSKGVKIVNRAPPAKEATLLVEKYYSPYFEMLKTLILELSAKVKIPSFIDLHSMPSKAEAYHLKINPNQPIHRPDFCLSDIEGLSCEPEFLHLIGSDLSKVYTNTNFNDPYFGGHITRFLNDTYTPLNNIQIEISREIYMNEETKQLIPARVTTLKPILTSALINHFQLFFTKYKH